MKPSHPEGPARENTESPQIIGAQSDISPPRGNPFPIVGIGASAGGLEAFGQLLTAIASGTGMAFVVVQHLDPAHESALPELLAPLTEMTVLPVADGIRVEPDRVYVIPPNTSMELEGEVLRLAPREAGLHLPIDIFFCSLAKVQGSRAIGVVLSGNASDGSVGVKAIKAECGITFAQSESTARFGGMPRNAVATGAVDYILAPADIARELNSIARHPFLIPSHSGDSGTETLPDGDGEMRRIFAMLHASTKVDFSHYKPTTVRRRIGRRMMVRRLETMSEYARAVEQDPGELRELYRDLLISVTSFFRDPGSFEALSQLLAGALNSRGNPDQPVRVWVPGCATGEEVYSLAICLYEVLQDRQLLVPLQLFGTDISDIALERSRQGVYPAIIEDDVSAERLRRFFTKADNGYQINKVIRENCIFARHDVTRDPPFSNLDLVSCRNLLIYLDQSAQRHILPIFHYALKPTGLLMLGTAESTAAAVDLFQPIDKQSRVYSRRAAPTRLPPELRLGATPADGSFSPGTPVAATALDIQKRLERVIQSRYSPDALLIGSNLQIVQFRGHTSTYLEPSPGEATLNILSMVKESLVLPLRRLLQSASEGGSVVRETNLPLEVNGVTEPLTVEVLPIEGTAAADRFYLVVFFRERQGGRNGSEVSATQGLQADEAIAMVQRELAETRDYLRNLKEEYEAHAEELRAANEEARSANEELQSTNEELGTTKEELQSANEELTTVNEELQSRNQELNTTNSDLKNLLSSVTVPILMVDSDLRVRRFNRGAATLLDLGPMDNGRPVGHLRGRIQTPRLEQQVKNVIETLHPFSEEVQDAQGYWFSLSIRPYRTIDDRIAGAVITFQDIDPLKRGLQTAEAARDYAEGIIETVREPLLVLDSDCRVQRATAAFYSTFLVSHEETDGRVFFDLGNGQWNQPRLRELVGAALFRSEPFFDHEMKHDFPHIGRRTVRLNGRRIPIPHSEQRVLLLSIEDMTERQAIAEARYQRLFETAKDGIIVIDVETETVEDMNPFFLQLSGYFRENFIGKNVDEVGRMLGIPQFREGIEASRNSEIVRHENLMMKTRTGDRVNVESVGNRYKVGGKTVIQFNVRDISARMMASKALRESEQRFRMFVESVSDYALFQTDPTGTILTWNTGAQRLLGWTEQEAVGSHFSMVFTASDIARGAPELELEIARVSGRSEDERWHRRRDNSEFFASGVLTQVCDDEGNLLGFAKVMRDVTMSKQQEERLRRSVEEKTTLVREIHHRVKNNLQVIVSLLSLQATHTNDSQVLNAFEETEGRLRAIAHIHERLYASEDLTDVEFGPYLSNLVQELVVLHSARAEQLDIDLNLGAVVLHIEQAIPLGLIANELIVNSLKHGLRGGPGRIEVGLGYTDETGLPTADHSAGLGWAKVQVADTGPGLPADLDLSRTQSMGFRLINLLLRQLRARIHFADGPGAAITVIFPLKSRNDDPAGE